MIFRLALIALLAVLLVMPARAAELFAEPFYTALDADGDVISGAKLNFYEPGTTTARDTFTDNDLAVAHANPVVADSAGRFAPIYLQALDYKVVLTDANDVTIKTIDPVNVSVNDQLITSTGSTTPRTLSARFADYINVLDYGATGDGTTDDTTAVKAALSAAKTAGTFVFFPAGTYFISDRLVFEAPIVGVSQRDTIIRADSTNWPAANTDTFDGATAVDPSTDQITISGHGYTTAQPVEYADGGGTQIVGLTDLNVYWIIVVDSNNIQLASTEALANAGTQIDITGDGVGASHSVTFRRMMLDFNDLDSTNDRKFIKNIIFDIANTSGLNGWNSTSTGGAGGSSNGYYERIHFQNVDHTAYPIDADSEATESGMLTGAIFDGLTIRGELWMKLGPNMDDVTFNGTRFFRGGDQEGSETMPSLDINVDNAVFNSTFIGNIGPLGNTIATGVSTFRPLIRVGNATNRGVIFDGLFVETTEASTTMTHVFFLPVRTFLHLRNVQLNIDDTNDTARALIYQQLTNNAKQGAIYIDGIIEGTSSPGGNPFGRLVETDRQGSLTEGSDDLAVYFSGVDQIGLDSFPFTMLKTPASNQARVPVMQLHGVFNGVRYAHGVTENTNAAHKGDRLYTATFDPATDVNTGTDVITFTGHEFETGDSAFFEDEGGTAPTGLTDETLYFIIKDSDNGVQLATTMDNAFAGTQIDITGTGTTAGQRLSRDHRMKRLHRDLEGSTQFTSASSTSPDDETVRLPGPGIYLVQITCKVGSDESHMAASTYIVYYNSDPTNDLSGADRVGTAKAVGNATDIVVQTAPDAQGDVVYRCTYTSGASTNRFELTTVRLNQMD